MARDDPKLHIRVPHFVHDDLDRLVARLGGEASETRLVAALIHAATLRTARSALRKYSDELGRQARR
jgi:hypothetical protein